MCDSVALTTPPNSVQSASDIGSCGGAGFGWPKPMVADNARPHSRPVMAA